VARRERTRHLIELGGLVQKAGLVELADDDRATSMARCSIWLDACGRIKPAIAGALEAARRRAFDAEAEEQEDSQ
jgi:hypothetical protein